MGEEKAGARAKKDKADEVETHRRTAGSALQAACSQDAFKEAIEAVQLFLPGCPLLGYLRFLQVWPLTQILTRFISTQFAMWNVVCTITECFGSSLTIVCAVRGELPVPGDGGPSGSAHPLHDTAPCQAPRCRQSSCSPNLHISKLGSPMAVSP